MKLMAKMAMRLDIRLLLLETACVVAPRVWKYTDKTLPANIDVRESNHAQTLRNLLSSPGHGAAGAYRGVSPIPASFRRRVSENEWQQTAVRAHYRKYVQHDLWHRP